MTGEELEATMRAAVKSALSAPGVVEMLAAAALEDFHGVYGGKVVPALDKHQERPSGQHMIKGHSCNANRGRS